jgi:adenosylcobinamide-phosphate guanylyltransferase
MAVTALIMAGGQATRMKTTTEKPLLEVGGRPMIERVAAALKQSRMVDRIVVAVSRNTPRTALKASQLSMEVLQTPGEGYISDMRYAIRKLGLSVVLTVAADIPFITTEIVDRAVEKYMSSGKPSLAVMAPADLYRRLGSEPEYVFQIDGQKLVPIGLNMIDGSMIDKPELDQAVLVTNSEESALNVNTPHELETARKRSLKANEAATGKTPLSKRTPRTYRLARISVLSALCVIGSFIHPPSPIQTVAFDSSPGFFAALYFGPLDGALVCGIGHIITSIVNGFPLGILHLPIALGMTLVGGIVGLVNNIGASRGYLAAVPIGVAINSGLVVVMVPTYGWAAALAFLPFLFVAACLNGLVAALAYLGVRGRLRL